MGNDTEKQSGAPDDLAVDRVDVPTVQEIEDVKGEVRQRTGAEQVESAELPEGTEFYRSGDMFIAFSRNLNKLYISRDGGSSFIEQVVTKLAFGGKIRVKDPDEESGIILTINDDGIGNREGVFERIATPPKISSVVPILEKLQIVYQFKLSDGTPFVVTCDENAENFYASFVVNIGDEKLRTISAERYRDGGTTIIKTDRGTFRIAPYGKSPTWNDEPLLEVN